MIDPLLGADDTAIRKAARKVTRDHSVGFALVSAQIVGSTPGCDDREYLSVLRGIGDEMMAEEKRK